jgi:hypothetical protein
MTMVCHSVIPSLFFMEMAVYIYFFYWRNLTKTGECLKNFIVCVTLDLMIVWCHYEARKDPGFVKTLTPINN